MVQPSGEDEPCRRRTRGRRLKAKAAPAQTSMLSLPTVQVPSMPVSPEPFAPLCEANPEAVVERCLLRRPSAG